MSLFYSKEWWRTRCGADESFDRQSLTITTLFGNEKKDMIIVGSHSGYLRIYSPSSAWNEDAKSPTGYKTTDLIIEAKIAECIIDVKVGKFVSLVFFP